MLKDPGLNPGELTEALRTAWAVDASAFRFMPSYDMRAATYEVTTAADRVCLKVRFGPIAETPLEAPRALLDAGIERVS